MKYIHLIALLSFALNINAQRLQEITVPVEYNGRILEMPFAGGMQAPQFSQVDLNRDGIPDLFVFDRVGETMMAFINNGDQIYTLDNSYLEHFPKMREWVSLLDYNGDGVPDIFTYTVGGASGIRVFNGSWEGDKLQFEQLFWKDAQNVPREYLLYRSKATGQIVANLYVFNVDNPAFVDVDGDGDLDILTFGSAGFTLNYYQNRSIEMGYGKDSLIFFLEDNCFGKFFESGATPLLDLSPNPDNCYEFLEDNDLPDENREARHAGSTVHALDATGNGLIDIILGDISFSEVVLAINGGTIENAWITDQDYPFPSDDVSVDLPVFPAAYSIDADLDGKLDLVFAPNFKVCGKGRDNVLLYNNISDTNEPKFSFVMDDFLVGDMIDLGWGASPTFFDYNGNGLLDLLVGNYNIAEDCESTWDSRLFLFENVGTNTHPEFKLVDDDYLNFSQFTGCDNCSFDFAPHIADMDGDGDLDLLVGDFDGRLFYAENIAGEGNPVAFGPIEYNWQGIQLETSLVPYVYDMNEDGLPDLLLGDRRGEVRYFQNVGTSTQPEFIPSPFEEPNIFRLGNMTTRGLSLLSSSAPTVVYEEGIKKVVVGSLSEGMHVFEVNSDLTQEFTRLENDPVTALNPGSYLRPAFADLTNDGYLEMVIGNRKGGLTLYKTNYRSDTTLTSSHVQILKEQEWSLSPNPARDNVKIQISSQMHLSYEIKVLSVTGQTVMSKKVIGNEQHIDVSHLVPGLYLVTLTSGTYSTPKKLLIK